MIKIFVSKYFNHEKFNRPGDGRHYPDVLFCQPCSNTKSLSANMYYDRSCNQYIYQRGRSWITSSFLPPGVYLDNSPRYPVYYYGPDVWKDNSLHQSRYYAQPQVVYGKQYEQHRYRVHERRYHDRDDRYNY